MAKLDVTTAWKALPYTSGTISNDSITAVEISKDRQDGIVIYPASRFSFDDVQLYIRSMAVPAKVRIVDFVEADYTANAEQIGEEIEKADEATTADKSDIDDLF